MFRKLVVAAAVSAALVTPAVHAQQGQGGQSGDMQWSQEQAQAMGTQIYLSTAGVRQIQQALNKQGYDSGKIDGQWSKQTSQAAKRYQQSKGLEPTGTPTTELISALGVQNVLSGQGGSQGGGQGGQQGGGNMKWQQESAQGPGTPLYVSTAGVRQIQQALNKQGYDVGDVDGIWGPSTQEAVRNYQRSQGIEPNGKLDLNLISTLGVGQQIFSGGQGGQGGSQQGGGNMQWQQETAQGQGTPLWAGPATVRQIQQKLNQQGFDVGSVDGSWSKQTSQAAKRYQQSNGLEPTGTLTTQLLSQLGMGSQLTGQGGGQNQSGQGQSGQSGQSQSQTGQSQTGQSQGGQQGQQGQQQRQ